MGPLERVIVMFQHNVDVVPLEQRGPVPALLFTVCDPQARRCWKTPGPYVAALTCAVLFAPHAIPLPIPRSRFRPTHLLVARRGQRGYQHFFTTAGRPFCLYAVIREPQLGAARADVGAMNDVLGSLSIERR